MFKLYAFLICWCLVPQFAITKAANDEVLSTANPVNFHLSSNVPKQEKSTTIPLQIQNNYVPIYVNDTNLTKDFSMHLNKEIKQKIKSSSVPSLSSNQATNTIVPSSSSNEYNIIDLTRVMETKLKDIRNNELGIPVIQVRLHNHI